MTKPLPPPDSPDRVAASQPAPSEPSPMQRFERLARGLINVPREDFLREEERYNLQNASRKQGIKR